MSILNNVTAMSASRQLHVSESGLRTAIERLTTGKRVNRASDDAAGMAKGTNFEATARKARESVKGFENTFYASQAQDGFLEEATNLALRMAELEGGGNNSSAEYSAVQTLLSTTASLGGATVASTLDATGALAVINTQRSSIASTMATAKTNANVQGITAENNFAQADTIMGADIGAEMVNMTKYQILSQSGTNALSQANQASQLVMGLFR